MPVRSQGNPRLTTPEPGAQCSERLGLVCSRPAPSNHRGGGYRNYRDYLGRQPVPLDQVQGPLLPPPDAAVCEGAPLSVPGRDDRLAEQAADVGGDAGRATESGEAPAAARISRSGAQQVLRHSALAGIGDSGRTAIGGHVGDLLAGGFGE
jgi:hypothetical protein